MRRAAASSRSASCDRTDATGRLRAAAAREIGQRLERGPRAAEMVEQGAEGARADILAADQAQPVEPLVVGELHTAGGSAVSRLHRGLSDLGFGAGEQARDIGAVHDEDEHSHSDEKQSGFRRLPSDHRTAGVAALATRADSDE